MTRRRLTTLTITALILAAIATVITDAYAIHTATKDH